MNCMSSPEHRPRWAPLPEPETQDVPGRRVGDRHAAALCLRAAATTEDVSERNVLRRRAAELILPTVSRTRSRAVFG